MSVAQTKSRLSIFRILAIALVVIAIGWIVARMAFPNRPTIFASVPPEGIGVRTGQLAPCPSTPNCLSSQSSDPEHYIAPLSANEATEEQFSSLKSLIQQRDRAKIVAETDNYLYAEFTSPWMGFVDDVEFVLNSQGKSIDVRSASRLGESDLGANRKRVETIRQQLLQGKGSEA
ncbi:DUF1499 domain-containing protein [Lusitaniella coriacea LEGE 07157]|uniref:DUF1499 domain-containing protein n=1 Tax=Lusitaniella coriacea LEGE 07157 TaxID=945747 RepID=A0A8J7DVN9_9CYAN|nr:DUF1499 domain-containing protein [Lusitaniella coriacea]MBE9115868.1 DUF1499 domain-containing protein [Lusitaniella coriacea LEGE 07157]